MLNEAEAFVFRLRLVKIWSKWIYAQEQTDKVGLVHLSTNKKLKVIDLV